jgi:hypothetical protein
MAETMYPHLHALQQAPLENNQTEMADMTKHPTQDPEGLEADIRKLVTGTEMIKYGRRGWPRHRGIRVTIDRDAIISHFTTKSKDWRLTSN